MSNAKGYSAASIAFIATTLAACGDGHSGAAPENGEGSAFDSGGMFGGAESSFGRASAGSTALPCDVEQAVQRNCQSCHAAQPLSGVPMALVTWEDFQQPAVSNPTLDVHRMVNMRVHDAASPMPPAPQRLSSQDKTALELWLAVGAPAGAGCTPTAGGTAGAIGTGGAAGVGSGTAGIGGGTAGVGGASDVPVAPPPDQGECYELLAHDAFDRSLPYTVDHEHYVNFYFDAPWPPDAQGISFESVFDEHPEIVHHWLLYVAGGGFYPFPQPDGAVEPNSNGSHFGATLVAGWAPGGNNGVNLPPDVGLDINGASRKLVLEIHFFANGSFSSRSGLRVCTTRTPRPNLATVSWLGTESISIPPGSQGTASGTCAPSTNQPIHILRSWPHMHRIGTHMTTVIHRAGGGSEVLIDEPFNFNTQIAYDAPATLNPGDTLTTTCTYENDTPGTVRYGTGTNDEMCFNFVTAWPANQLQHGTSMNGAANPCMN